MSTQLNLYLELKHNNQSWINITNKNIFDGFDLVNVDINQPLPAFSYPCNQSFIHDLQQFDLDIHSLKRHQLSIQSQTIYNELSNEVTGHSDGLNIWTVSIQDLVKTYNDHLRSKSLEQQFIQELIARIMNSYYYQLNIAGDRRLLLPDNRHQAPVKEVWQNIRLVGWLD